MYDESNPTDVPEMPGDIESLLAMLMGPRPEASELVPQLVSNLDRIKAEVAEGGLLDPKRVPSLCGSDHGGEGNAGCGGYLRFMSELTNITGDAVRLLDEVNANEGLIPRREPHSHEGG